METFKLLRKFKKNINEFLFDYLDIFVIFHFRIINDKYFNIFPFSLFDTSVFDFGI